MAEKEAPEVVKAKKPAAKPAAPSKYTKRWAIEHPAFPPLRPYADTEDEAVAEFVRLRCPNWTPAQARKDMVIYEIPFTPADTELDKPYGWKKPVKGPKTVGRVLVDQE
jgi:hypothetical protein